MSSSAASDEGHTPQHRISAFGNANRVSSGRLNLLGSVGSARGSRSSQSQSRAVSRSSSMEAINGSAASLLQDSPSDRAGCVESAPSATSNVLTNFFDKLGDRVGQSSLPVQQKRNSPPHQRLHQQIVGYSAARHRALTAPASSESAVWWSPSQRAPRQHSQTISEGYSPGKQLLVEALSAAKRSASLARSASSNQVMQAVRSPIQPPVSRSLPMLELVIEVRYEICPLFCAHHNNNLHSSYHVVGNISVGHFGTCTRTRRENAKCSN